MMKTYLLYVNNNLNLKCGVGEGKGGIHSRTRGGGVTWGD